ncbi:MAG: glycoside hydrolase family 3 protein, partial [Candidatus Neomarinimicrobiota bacterium]
MKRIRPIVRSGVGLAILILFLLNGCAVAPSIKEEKPKVLGISDLSLEEKVAQMFMTRYTGGFYTESSYVYQQVKRLVKEHGIGGIIPFFGSTHGTIENLNELQRLSRIPLLVAADYERGVGQQLDGATLFPTNMGLAATDSPELAYNQGMITAKEARAVGVHITFAPVMDVNSNPDNPIINFRAFGDSPEIVSRFGVEFIKGAQESGLIATAKHFPGHGDTGTDSHTTLPVIEKDNNTFESVDLVPFKAAIDAGVKMIMVGHIAVPSLDESGKPATLSNKLNGDLLRNKLGFEGIIVTDAMEMGGITESYWAGEAAIKTIETGTDMVLLPMDIDRAISAVTEAVRSGRISEDRIDASVKRILEAKRELGLWDQREVSLKSAQSILGQDKFLSAAGEVSRKSITLVSDKANLIPIQAESVKNPIHILIATDEGMLPISRPFRSSISRIFENVETRFIYYPLDGAEVQSLLNWAKES